MAEPLRPKFGAFVGIRNTVPVERLGEADLSAAVNVDLDDTGRATARAGRTLKIAGDAHSIWAPDDGSEPCLFVQGGALKRVSPADPDLESAVTLASGLTADRMRYVKVNDRVYHTNSRVTGVYDLATGAVRSWGMETPSLPAIGVTVGYLSAGAYLFTLRAAAADGRVSGAPLSGRVDLTDGAGITFTWGDIDGEYVEIFLTEPNGEALYRAAVVRADAGTFTWTGGRLALPLDTQFLDPAPAGQGLAYANGTIYIATGEYLFASKPLAYELFDLRDYLAFDGTRIGFVVGMDGGLYVGTEKAVYFAAGAILRDMAPRVVVDARAVADSALIADSAKATGQGQGRIALFATALGIHAGTPDGQVSNLTIERFTFDAPATAAAALRVEDEKTQYLLIA